MLSHPRNPYKHLLWRFWAGNQRAQKVPTCGPHDLLDGTFPPDELARVPTASQVSWEALDVTHGV